MENMFKNWLEKELLKKGYLNDLKHYLGEDTFLNILLKLMIEWENQKKGRR